MLRDDQYALITIDGTEKVKRYPIDSAQNVINSYLEYVGDKEMDASERATAGYFLKNACAMFGMDLPLEKTAGCGMPNDGPKTSNVIRKKKPLKKMASVPQYTAFALKGKYPIDTPDLVKQASEYFDEHWLHFSQGSRRIYAQNVQKQASLLGVNPGRLIQKFASNQFSNGLDHELSKRAHLTGSDAFEKLASYKGKVSVDEFTMLLTELDAKHGIQSSYNKSILDPMASVLKDPIEKLASSGMMWDIGGIEYSEENMKKGLAHPDVLSLYGEGLVSQLRDPAVFDELPMADKKVILQYGSVR